MTFEQRRREGEKWRSAVVREVYRRKDGEINRQSERIERVLSIESLTGQVLRDYACRFFTHGYP